MPVPIEANQSTNSGKGRFECTVNITGVNRININGGVHITEAGSKLMERAEGWPFSQPSGTESGAAARSAPRNRISHPTLSNKLENPHRLTEEVDRSVDSDNSDESRASSESIYSDNLLALSDTSENGAYTTTSSTSIAQLQPSVHLTFEIEHLAPHDLAKVERLTRALHSGSDKWAIMLRERCSSTRYMILGVGSASLLGFHEEETWKVDVKVALKAVREFNDLKKASPKNRWRIVWKPSDPVNAVRNIENLDDAIRWAEQSDRVYPHLEKPSSEKEWEEARKEARRKTAHLVKRYWICCACYPKGAQRDRYTELWHLKKTLCQTSQCGHTRCNSCDDGTGFGQEDVHKVLIEWEFQENGW